MVLDHSAAAENNATGSVFDRMTRPLRRAPVGLQTEATGIASNVSAETAMPAGSEEAVEEPIRFTYAEPDDPPMRYAFIRAVELMSGQRRLKSIYMRHRRNLAPGEDFWAAAMRHLKFDVQVNADGLKGIPAEGPLVIVANHPFGVVDGLVIGYLVSRVRKEYRILTNGVLTRATEIRDVLLPIDFRGGDKARDAQRINLQTRAEARRLLERGGCLVVFPGGTVSTALSPFGVATDPEWKPFTARLIQETKATVVPVFFSGQNSRLFQWASHVSPALRLALLFREVNRRIGKSVKVHIGQPLDADQFAHIRDRRELAEFLRRQVYLLGGIDPGPAWQFDERDRPRPTLPVQR